jgi:glycosyltransferase involved in cell wall biosynthesis
MEKGRIKVLRVIPQLHIAGTSNGLKRAVERLDRTRFEIKVCGLYWWGQVGEDLRSQGIDTIFLKARPHPYGFSAIHPLATVIREFQPDIVHTHLDAANIAGTVASLLTRAPALITNQHNAKPNRGKLIRLMEYWLTPASSRIAIISYRAAQLYADQITHPLRQPSLLDYNPPDAQTPQVAESDPHVVYGAKLQIPTTSRIKQGKFHVIYAVAPVDNYTFRTEKSVSVPGVEGWPVIGNVARLTGQKGQTYLLQAFQRVLVEYPSARLLMLGDGPLRRQLEQQALDLGIAGRVTFTGKQPHVFEVLQGLDVFVMPSLWEGCGTAALEAMAVGVPIVASAVGGLSEAIVPGVTGLLVPPAEPESLAQAILEVLGQPEPAVERAQSARRRMELFFSPDEAAARTESLYEQVLAAKRDGGGH